MQKKLLLFILVFYFPSFFVQAMNKAHEEVGKTAKSLLTLCVNYIAQKYSADFLNYILVTDLQEKINRRTNKQALTVYDARHSKQKLSDKSMIAVCCARKDLITSLRRLKGQNFEIGTWNTHNYSYTSIMPCSSEFFNCPRLCSLPQNYIGYYAEEFHIIDQNAGRDFLKISLEVGSVTTVDDNTLALIEEQQDNTYKNSLFLFDIRIPKKIISMKQSDSANLPFRELCSFDTMVMGVGRYSGGRNENYMQFELIDRRVLTKPFTIIKKLPHCNVIKNYDNKIVYTCADTIYKAQLCNEELVDEQFLFEINNHSINKLMVSESAIAVRSRCLKDDQQQVSLWCNDQLLSIPFDKDRTLRFWLHDKTLYTASYDGLSIIKRSSKNN